MARFPDFREWLEGSALTGGVMRGANAFHKRWGEPGSARGPLVMDEEEIIGMPEQSEAPKAEKIRKETPRAPWKFEEMGFETPTVTGRTLGRQMHDLGGHRDAAAKIEAIPPLEEYPYDDETPEERAERERRERFEARELKEKWRGVKLGPESDKEREEEEAQARGEAVASPDELNAVPDREFLTWLKERPSTARELDVAKDPHGANLSDPPLEKYNRPLTGGEKFRQLQASFNTPEGLYRQATINQLARDNINIGLAGRKMALLPNAQSPDIARADAFKDWVLQDKRIEQEDKRYQRELEKTERFRAEDKTESKRRWAQSELERLDDNERQATGYVSKAFSDYTYARNRIQESINEAVVKGTYTGPVRARLNKEMSDLKDAYDANVARFKPHIEELRKKREALVKQYGKTLYTGPGGGGGSGTPPVVQPSGGGGGSGTPPVVQPSGPRPVKRGEFEVVTQQGVKTYHPKDEYRFGDKKAVAIDSLDAMSVGNGRLNYIEENLNKLSTVEDGGEFLTALSALNGTATAAGISAATQEGSATVGAINKISEHLSVSPLEAAAIRASMAVGSYEMRDTLVAKIKGSLKAQRHIIELNMQKALKKYTTGTADGEDTPPEPPKTGGNKNEPPELIKRPAETVRMRKGNNIQDVPKRRVKTLEKYGWKVEEP